MHKFSVAACLLLMLGIVAVAQQPAPRSAAPAPRQAARPASDPAAQQAPIGSIKEIMDSLIDPAADAVFDAVFYEITPAGTVEHEPRTTEDWAEVRRHALLLAEASNLLKVPGRRVVPDHPIIEFEIDAPSPEDLKPEEIQALIDVDPAKFSRLAQGLADAALLALKAVDARSVEQLFDAGDDLDLACETCHSEYWYPKDRRPAAAALSQRKR